jgi:hypothetical protein
MMARRKELTISEHTKDAESYNNILLIAKKTGVQGSRNWIPH